MATILTATGISLYLNTRRKYGIEVPTEDQMRQYLRTEPGVASAEANSILQISQPDDHLVLLHTETPEAEKCADLLRDFFINNRGFKHVQLVKLQFQDDEKHIETHGLRNFVNTFIDEIEKAKRNNQDVVINATPGFKLESGYSTIIGMLYQVPVKYIHEKFKRVVTFNPIALNWDTSLFLNYSSFFQWLDGEPRSQSDVENWLKALPDRERIRSLLTLPDENEDVFLSPLGDVFLQRFKQEAEEANEVAWPSLIEAENADDKIASSLKKITHHYPKDTLAACNKIAQLPYVRAIMPGNFENTTRSGIKKALEDGTILLLWADNEKAANLIVQTTGQGLPQTRKVAEKIREILEIQ
jgi:putative CRISPR-associated protein (TIGR02619 family)